MANICWIWESKRLQKNIYFCFIDYIKTFDCMDHNKMSKILKQMEIRDCLTWFLSNLYADQEAIVRIGDGTMVWFKIGKEVCLGSILPSCLFNLHAEYTIWNATLDEAQVGIKIAGILHCRWECKLVQLLWKTVWRFLKKTGNRTPIWPSNPIYVHTHQWNQIWKRHVQPNVHRSTLFHSQDMEAT